MESETQERDLKRVSYRGHVLVEVERPTKKIERARGFPEVRMKVRIFGASPEGGMRRVGQAPFVEMAKKQVDALSRA